MEAVFMIAVQVLRLIAHGSLEYQTSVEFITRYRDDVYVDQRLVHDGVNYNIRRVDNKFRNSKYMLIVCDGGVVN